AGSTMPADATSASMTPKRDVASSAARETASPSATSAGTMKIRPARASSPRESTRAASASRSASLATSETRSPRSSSRSATASPMPLDPPVTSTCRMLETRHEARDLAAVDGVEAEIVAHERAEQFGGFLHRFPDLLLRMFAGDEETQP